MYSDDMLGEKGREALNACVKVKIIGTPDTRRYDRIAAVERLQKCYAGSFPNPGLKRRLLELERGPVLEQLLPGTVTDSYNITDIYEALVRFDEIPYVDKYPAVEGTDSDQLKNLFVKRHEDVEREVKKAKANPDERHRYSWLVAQRRVRDCFAGNFPEDVALLEDDRSLYSITEIHDAITKCDVMSFQNNFHPTRGHLCTHNCRHCLDVRTRLGKVDSEYADATSPAHADIKQVKYPLYSEQEVLGRLKGCICGCARTVRDQIKGLLPTKGDESKNESPYNIFDICNTLCRCDEKFSKLTKYPSEGPGSVELKGLIDSHRDDVKREYQEENKDYKYSRSEAEHRVRDCFAGSFLISYTDLFAKKGNESPEILKIDQTYDIFNIKDTIQYFDSKKLVDKYSEEEGPEADKKKTSVDEERAGIKKEYDEATVIVEIEHGSGFIIQDHFVVTNKHVIESALNDNSNNTQILISNAALGEHELPCEIAHVDKFKDLALLYCPDLKIDQIRPLQLSNQPLLPGMQIFSFGFPVSHTGDTALFVNGYVSGSTKAPEGHTMAVLNCPLNSGNSGGPVLCWVEGQLKVVGVATQKHSKDILNIGEAKTIAKIREMLQTSVIPEEWELKQIEDDIKCQKEQRMRQLMHSGQKRRNFKKKFEGDLPPAAQTPLFLLMLKLYEDLETYSQFNLSNALPGNLVIELVKNSVNQYQGDCKDELAEILKVLLP